MNILPLLSLITWQMTNSLIVVTPPYPPLAFHGGNIVAVIEPSKSGDTKAVMLHAEPPFVDVALMALKQWRFPDGQRNKSALVVVNFRDWASGYIEADNGGIRFVPHSEQIDWAEGNRPTPLPRFIIDPLYPDLSPGKATFVVAGAVVLHLSINASGTVNNVEVVQGIRDFNQPVIEAVRKWRFAPAKDDSGKPVDSDAYAVCVYRPLPLPQEW